MANDAYLPGNILSMASAAANWLIHAGSGDASLLYLYLLKTGGLIPPLSLSSPPPEPEG